MLAPLPVVGAVGRVGLPGAAGADRPASTRSRSIFGSASLPSIASAGFSVTVTEPEPLSPASASLKSCAAMRLCESSTPPSKLNVPASNGDSGGTGWPARLTRLATKPDSDSAEAVATPERLAFGPSSESLPLKPSLPPPASSASVVARPSLALAPTARSILSGAPLTVALPASE